MGNTLKSPINWFGGKYYMAKKIVEIFPEHKTFVEVFGGSGQVLFTKQPSEIEVYNDIDSGLYGFFKLLRDNNKAEKLKEKLDLTPFSREEFYHCRDNWRNETDELERVRKWYVTVMQSFSANMSSWKPTKSVSRRGMAQSVSQWLRHIENNLPLAIERLKTVQIENMDFLEILKKYDSKETLFYLDPPYIHKTRKMTYEYDHEMNDDQHKMMVESLLKIKGKVVLSGYDNEIYDILTENGWGKLNIGDYSKRSIKTIKSEKEKGTEYIWINFQ